MKKTSLQKNLKAARFRRLLNLKECFYPLLLLLLGGLSIIIAQWLYLVTQGYGFTVGRPSPQTYRVLTSVKYEDRSATGTLREMARDSVVGVAVRDVAARNRMQKRLSEVAQVHDSDKAQSLEYMPQGLMKALLAMPPHERDRLLSLTSKIGDACFSRLDSADVLGTAGGESALLWEEIGGRIDSAREANLVYQLLMALGDFGYRLDPKLTQTVRQSAENRIPVVERRLEPGDVLAEKGAVITPQTARLLRLQGYMEDHFPLAQIVILFLLVIGLPFWIAIPAIDALNERPSWRCIVFVVGLSWFFQALAVQLRIAGAGVLPAVLLASLCVPGPFAFRLALAGTVSGAFLIIGLSAYDLLLLLAMDSLASMAGFYALRRLDSWEKLSRSVFFFSLFLALVRMSILWVQGVPFSLDSFRLYPVLGYFWKEVWHYMALDVLLALLVVQTLPMLENFLGVLSILRLRELNHPSSPLLRKLQRDAPGTYQHCLAIGTLAEAVARELGMDENLMKAGAYYHDIGKLRRPQFFVENQGGGVNVHDGMSPTLSALAILSHVRDGAEMAREYGLPRRIRDFILEHHGTGCIRYFYNKARALGEKAEWSAFCYPGPKPQTRETALLMVLDSLEAAIRSEAVGRELLKLEEEQKEQGKETSPVPASGNAGRAQEIMAVRKVIDQVVRSKMNEGQFDEVNFTLRDLTRIKEALLSVLLSMYHTRKVKRIERRAPAARQEKAPPGPAVSSAEK